MQEKAVRFLRDVIGDPDRAEEFEAMSPEEYAEHKRIEIWNPDRLKQVVAETDGRLETLADEVLGRE